MKYIYLTFDIETIVSGISSSVNYLSGVYLGTMYIAEELRKRELKATFYMSLSSKRSDISNSEYSDLLTWLFYSLKSYDNIKIEPHLHSYNLPVSFDAKYDGFGKYSLNEQVELLEFAKSFFKEKGLDVSSFRPGGFSNNENYYKALSLANYKYSSLLEKEKEPTIDMITGEINPNRPYLQTNDIMEYPVTSVKVLSIKRKEEILNLSPDFFTLESVEKYIQDLDYININFHSFSIYLNRLIRENHKNLWSKNLKFLLFENITTKLIGKFSNLQSINTKTVMRRELIKWLEYIKKNNFETFFIGE